MALPSRLILFSCIFPAMLGCSRVGSSSDPLALAEKLSEEKRYDEAIVIYQEHMTSRLAQTGRPEWENPHFYLLLIGDLQLQKDQPQEALLSYSEAEKQGIEASLVADRYRSVANWYVDHQELEKALDVLRRFRDRDSLLFDAMLDRVARSLTAQESLTAKPASKSAAPKK